MQRIGELNFSSGPTLGAGKLLENGGSKNVAPDDGKIGRCLARLRLFHHVVNAEEPSVPILIVYGHAMNDTVVRDGLALHTLDSHDATAVALEHIHHLFQARHL